MLRGKHLRCLEEKKLRSERNFRHFDRGLTGDGFSFSVRIEVIRMLESRSSERIRHMILPFLEENDPSDRGDQQKRRRYSHNDEHRDAEDGHRRGGGFQWQRFFSCNVVEADKFIGLDYTAVEDRLRQSQNFVTLEPDVSALGFTMVETTCFPCFPWNGLNFFHIFMMHVVQVDGPGLIVMSLLRRITSWAVEVADTNMLVQFARRGATSWVAWGHQNKCTERKKKQKMRRHFSEMLSLASLLVKWKFNCRNILQRERNAQWWSDTTTVRVSSRHL